jgi:hypothetical protein
VSKSEPNLGTTDNDDDSLPLSTRDVELEPVSLRDIEMILAPGKAPPPLHKKAAPKTPAAVRVRQSPAKADAAAALPRPRKVASQPPKVAAKPTAPRDESATVDLDALLGGASRSVDASPTSNLDVVIAPADRRGPKPVPKPPLKSRASAPDDGPTALDVKAPPATASTVDTREWATGSEPPPPVETPTPEDVAPKAKPKLALEGPQALEAFVMEDEPAGNTGGDEARLEDAALGESGEEPVDGEAGAAGAAPSESDSLVSPKAAPPRAKERSVPKPPRRERRDPPETDGDTGPKSSRKSASGRPRAAAKTLEPAPRKSVAAPVQEKKRPIALYAGIGAAAAGLLIYLATGSGETPKPTPPSVAQTPAPAATQATMPERPGATTTPEQTATAQEPTAAEPSAAEPAKSAAPALTGRLPVGAEPTTTSPAAPPVATAPATTKPTAAPGGEFDKAAAAAALGGAVGQASGCKSAGDPSGVAKVSVTFAPSGRVTQALVLGPPFAGTATGGCIARAFRTASVPSFAGDPQTVTKTVNIP